jgi:hypothetical protein
MFWAATPRKLIACLDEFWYLEQVKAFEAAAYNLQFIGVLFSEQQNLPEPPVRKSAPPKIAMTNAAGEAMLKGMF